MSLIQHHPAAPARSMLIVASAAFSIASMLSAVAAVPLAIAGLGFTWASLRGRRDRTERTLVVASVAALICACGILVAELTRIPPITAIELVLWAGIPAVLSLLVLMRARRKIHPPVRLFVGVLVVMTVGIALMVIAQHHGSPVGIDVYISHGEAADVLRAGGDPYGEDLVVFDGRPDAQEDEMIFGYSYPPITMLTYVASHLAVGDSRWVNVVAWIAVLLTIGVGAVRRNDAGMLAVLLVASAFGAWRLVVYTGWTEPITIALLLLAGALWHKNGIAAAVALGLALATKQYMILAAPLLLVGAPRLGKTRTIGAIAVAALSVLPFMLVWRDTMIEALVLRFLRAEYRSDTRSIPALVEALGGTPRPFLYLGLGATAAVSWYAGRRITGYAGLMAGIALALGSFFLFTQALTNYWFLVAACCVLAAWAAGAPKTVYRVPRLNVGEEQT